MTACFLRPAAPALERVRAIGRPPIYSHLLSACRHSTVKRPARGAPMPHFARNSPVNAPPGSRLVIVRLPPSAGAQVPTTGHDSATAPPEAALGVTVSAWPATFSTGA